MTRWERFATYLFVFGMGMAVMGVGPQHPVWAGAGAIFTGLFMGRWAGGGDLPPVRCGNSSVSAREEKLIREIRAAESDRASEFDGCGRAIRLDLAFRCVQCGMWGHRDCLQRHFGAS